MWYLIGKIFLLLVLALLLGVALGVYFTRQRIHDRLARGELAPAPHDHQAIMDRLAAVESERDQEVAQRTRLTHDLLRSAEENEAMRGELLSHQAKLRDVHAEVERMRNQLHDTEQSKAQLDQQVRLLAPRTGEHVFADSARGADVIDLEQAREWSQLPEGRASWLDEEPAPLATPSADAAAGADRYRSWEDTAPSWAAVGGRSAIDAHDRVAQAADRAMTDPTPVFVPRPDPAAVVEDSWPERHAPFAPPANSPVTDLRPPAPFFSGPTGADDLLEVVGVERADLPALESLGIATYRQLAMLDAVGVEQLRQSLPGRPERVEQEEWLHQAAHLHEVKYGEHLG